MNVIHYIFRTLLSVIPGTLLIGVIVCLYNGISGLHFVVSLLITLLFGVLLGIVSAAMNHKRFVAPIGTIVTYVDALKNGDLTVNADPKKAGMLSGIVDSMNQMRDTWNAIIKEVNEASVTVNALSEELSSSAEQTTAGSNQMASAIHEVASGSEQQHLSVQEGLDAVSQMSSGMKQVSSHSHHASQSARVVLDTAQAGSQKVEHVIEDMTRLDSSMNDLKDVISTLNHHSNEIGLITNVITEISEQTNLLALNAAIEAARAGENGRGFAVVADEVRKLAEQSAQSAGQIIELIQSIQGMTSKAVQSTTQAGNEVKTSKEGIEFAGQSFEQIKRSSAEANQLIKDVSTHSSQVTEYSERVLGLISQIASITETAVSNSQTVSASAQEQLASMEEITSASLNLAKTAETLQLLVDQFKI